MNKPKQTPAKAPYRSPRFTVFGPVRDLTGFSGNVSGNSDGGMSSNKKTH